MQWCQQWLQMGLWKIVNYYPATVQYRGTSLVQTIEEIQSKNCRLL